MQTINIYPTRSCYDLGKQKLLFIVLSILLHYTELANRRVSKEKTPWDSAFSHGIFIALSFPCLPQASCLPHSCCLVPSDCITSDGDVPGCHCTFLQPGHTARPAESGGHLVPWQLGVMMQLVPQKPISSFKEGRGKKGRGKSLWSTLKLLCHPSLLTFTDQTSFNIFAE